jgi:hypothetical protein
MADTPNEKPGKEPFISQSDRPEVRLKSDTPLSNVTVRQLATILGQFGTRKDFWDGKDWQKDDFDGGIKWKDVKEFKEGKEVKEVKEIKEKEKEKEIKEFKEKREIKELKAEKVEVDGVFEQGPQLDPRIDQVIRALAGLSAKVDQLADQVEELKKGKG